MFYCYLLTTRIERDCEAGYVYFSMFPTQEYINISKEKSLCVCYLAILDIGDLGPDLDVCVAYIYTYIYIIIHHSSNSSSDIYIFA